jgi:hypothetical protein
VSVADWLRATQLQLLRVVVVLLPLDSEMEEQFLLFQGD